MLPYPPGAAWRPGYVRARRRSSRRGLGYRTGRSANATTSHPDHQAATAAAAVRAGTATVAVSRPRPTGAGLGAARRRRRQAPGRDRATVRRAATGNLDFAVPVDRACQRKAARGTPARFHPALSSGGGWNCKPILVVSPWADIPPWPKPGAWLPGLPGSPPCRECDGYRVWTYDQVTVGDFGCIADYVSVGLHLAGGVQAC